MTSEIFIPQSSGDGNVPVLLLLTQAGVVAGDPSGFACDGAAESSRIAEFALHGIAREPAGSLLVGHRKVRRAVPELRQVLDDPALPHRPAGEATDAGGVDQAKV